MDDTAATAAPDDVESMAACLLAEFDNTSWSRALAALRAGDPRRDLYLRAARIAVEHVRYLPTHRLRLMREDFAIQTEAALRSVQQRHYATARAELRGAVMILDALEKRDEPADEG